MLYKFAFLGFATTFACCEEIVKNVPLNLIIDVSSTLFPATRISAHFCPGETESLLDLSRRFSSSRLSHNIRGDFDDLPSSIYDNRQHANLYILDMDCRYSIGALEKANNSELFVGPTKWLLLREEKSWDDEEIRETFRNLSVYPDSDVLLARRKTLSSESEHFELLSIYRPSPYRGVVLESRGNWSRTNGVSLDDRRVAAVRRMNLQRTPLRSCLVMTDPDTINHLTDYQHKRTDPVTKASYAWIIHMVNRMNATISFEISDSWGYRMPNGSYSGMIGMLQRKEIDIGGTSTFLTADRIEIVEYIQLYTKTRSMWLFRQPLLSTVSNIFTLPFQKPVWIGIGLVLSLVIPLLYLSMKWEYSQVSATKSADYWSQLNPTEPTFSDDLLIILGAVAQQGYAYEPYKVPSRIVTFMVLIFALSLYASYTANIVALLQATTDAIKTLPDLLYSPLKKGAQDVIYNRYYFKTFTDPVRKALVNQVEGKGKKGNWISLDEGVRRMRNELFAFHGEIGSVYQVVQETFYEAEKCGLTEIDFLKVIYPLMAIQKRSPYLEIIRNCALKIKESGLQDREHFRFWTKKPECYGNTNFISIGFQECYFALVIMGYGVLFTLAVLILEILWHKRQSAKMNTNVEMIQSPPAEPADIFD